MGERGVQVGCTGTAPYCVLFARKESDGHGLRGWKRGVFCERRVDYGSIGYDRSRARAPAWRVAVEVETEYGMWCA